jgi:hypothetical protein
MLQLRFIPPLNPPTPLSARLNVAFCPAEMVCEVGDPDAGATVKSGGVTFVELRSTNIVDKVLSMIKSGFPSPFMSAVCRTGG